MRNIKTNKGFGLVYKEDYPLQSVRSGCGLVASWHFESPHFMEAMHFLFRNAGYTKDECQEIVAIEITREGIKAHFEGKSNAMSQSPEISRVNKTRKKK